MTELNRTVDSFLTELKASLSQSDRESFLRRVNAERLLRLLAEEFVEAQQAERVRVLPDHRLVGEAGADFLLQIDDYDVRLELLDAPDRVAVLDPEHLAQFLDLLERNPSTVALILVWTTDDLQSVALYEAPLRLLLQNPERLPDILGDSAPLPETLRALVARQIKLWEIGLDQAPHSVARATDMRRLFEEAIGSAIETERQRSYRYTERKMAAERFPVEREKRLIFEVLGEALSGVTAEDLVPRLARLSRRGER